MPSGTIQESFQTWVNDIARNVDRVFILIQLRLGYIYESTDVHIEYVVSCGDIDLTYV